MPVTPYADLMREHLHAKPARLAPMASFTNLPFRRVAIECGSGFTTNEEIDADALIRQNSKAIELARKEIADGIVAMQLLGNSAETLVPAALQLVDAGADIIDLNMGCPVPKIVNRGKGAALMRDVRSTAAILTALRAALPSTPLTIKIRGGWDESESNAVEVARMAQDVGVDAITVHPRTRAQRYAGHAPWDVIREVVQAVEIPVTGNGDVTSLAEARAMAAATGCESVMIGRAALGQPWIFDATYEQLDTPARLRYQQRVITHHLELIETYLTGKSVLIQAKKHLTAYAAGRRDARALREVLFKQTDITALRDYFWEYVFNNQPFTPPVIEGAELQPA